MAKRLLSVLLLSAVLAAAVSISTITVTSTAASVALAMIAAAALAAIVSVLVRIRSQTRDLEQALVHAQIQAQSREAWINDIIEGTLAGTWEWNVATGSTVFNERWAEIVGYSLEELEPVSIDTWKRLAHPDDLQRSEALLQKHFSGELPHYECESRMLHKHGHWVWVLDRGRVMQRTSDGSPLLMRGTHQDITNRKERAAFLQQNQARLDEAELTGNVGSWDYNLNTGELTWSRQTYRIYGREPEHFRPTFDAVVAHYPDGDLQLVVDAFQQALQQQTELRIDHRILTGDGTMRHVQEIGRLILGEGGAPVRMVGSVVDITSRKEAELALARSNRELERQVAERTRTLAEAQRIAGLGSWRLDLKTDLVDWTPELYELFRLPPDSPPPNYAQQTTLFEPESWQQLTSALTQTVQTGIPYELELKVRRVDGSSGWIFARGERFCDDRGHPIAIQGVAMDITLRKESEQLIQEARDAAEAANQAKSAFLANMSHEIRTPLNAISGMTYLLSRSGVTPAQAQKIEKIESAGSHLLAIINDVLDLSKIEAGKFTLSQEKLQMEDVLKSVLAMVSAKAQAKNLALKVEYAMFPRGLLGDRTRLQQALLNYLSNAVKFTERGAITLRATVLDDNPTDALLRFEVSDTGPGIAAEALPRLFSAFEQADNTITRKYGGTGLGLAITRRIAHLLHGDAGVDTVVGQGSTFWLTARLAKGSDEAVAPIATDEPNPGDLIRKEFPGARVLLAEDEPLNREIALILLEDAGLRADSAEDGAQALRKWQDNPYDLVLMDMQMPTMDGLEATRQIRQQPRSRVPVIAMTANAFAEDRARCLEAGMDDFLTKPIKPAAFYATLLHWLRQKQARR